ncbi:MAG: DNA repair protein [Ignavibacteriae bacterium]|nr:MAG: DNA repair protein [Ignavibacteriota bacterium]
MHILTSIIRLPEISLLTRDAHKLRGFFGNLFKEKSPLLHNHFDDGSLVFKYPLVQYKVIENIPMLIGLNEGAELLTSLFLKMKELDINGKTYPINYKNIENKKCEFGLCPELHEYSFKTLWMGLNQENYEKYNQLKKYADESGIPHILTKILVGNILSFFKSTGYHADNTILLKTHLKEKTTGFKGNKMLAFEGNFIANVLLPQYIGLGKSVSRGFGTIVETATSGLT